MEAIRSVLDERGIGYLAGKTWTTDGLYRETPGRVARRRAEGCLTVEMECSAFCAVARFRGATFGQIRACASRTDDPFRSPPVVRYHQT